MYKIEYSTFRKMWIVIAPDGLAHSAWLRLRDARSVTHDLNLWAVQSGQAA